jgi:DNA helicase HerA-like ATPase
MNIHTSFRISVLGKTGSGKTVFLKSLLKNFSKQILILIYDIKHDYSDVREITDLNRFNFNLQKGLARYKSRGSKEDLENFCKTAWFQITKDKTRRIILVFDEISALIENQPLASVPYFKKCLVMGRSYGIGMWFASQRPAILNKTILSQSRYIFLFKLDHPLDLKAVQFYVPNEKELLCLREYHFLVYEDGHGYVHHDPVKA